MKRAKHALAAICLIVSACTARLDTQSAPPRPADTQAPAAGHEHHEMAELPATGGPGYTAADVRFMQHMIGHHAQAIVMAGLAPERAAGEHVLKLAQKIDISQRDEIVFMEHWLAERKQAVPDSAQSLAMQMPGMLTAQQLAQLSAARGREFDRLFLTFMIQHHRGALVMADTLFASPGAAQDSDIFRFVTDVVTDQGDEIYVMQVMLDAIRGSGDR